MKKDIFRLFTQHLSEIIVFLAIILTITSCPTPLNEDIFLQVKDDIAPGITILSPAEGSSYASTVVVTGIVSDSSTSEGNEGGIMSFAYEVMGTGLSGAIIPDTDSSFEFSFPTTNLSGSIAIQLTAIDWNGNQLTESLTLVDEGAIPSFSLQSGNSLIIVEWDPVPLSVGYSLYYTDNGTLPSENYGSRVDTVETSITLTGLENGSMHVFLLKSISAEGENNWSDYGRAIPLGPTTLAPAVIGKYNRIVLSWEGIEATDEYHVEKATSISGSYTNISGDYRGTTLTDEDVEFGQSYFYRVLPALEGGIKSEAVACIPGYFPYEGIARISVLSRSTVNEVQVRGDYAYLATDSDNLVAINISDPSSPMLTAEIDVDNCREIAFSGSYLVGARAGGTADQQGLWIFDLTIPSTPTIAYTNTGSGFHHIASDGQMVYAVDPFSFVRPYQINENPLSVTIYSDYSIPSGYDIAAGNDYMYIADGGNGLKAVNMSVPAIPSLDSELNVGVNFKAASAYGTEVYTIESLELSIIDVSDPVGAGISEISSTPIPGYPSFLDVQGEYAYVANNNDGVYVFDITDSSPGGPFIAAKMDTSKAVRATGVGKYVYVADRYEGLIIGEMRFPLAPQEWGTGSGGFTYDVHKEGDLLYTAASGLGLIIFNVSNSGIAPIVGSWDSSNAKGIDVCGNLAFLADDSEGLRILDVSEPDSPVILSTFNCSNANDVVIRGNYAYIADYYEGIKIVDVGDPSNPVLTGVATTNPYTEAIALQGDYVYAVGYNEFSIVDINSPQSPFEIAGSVIPLDRPHDIVVSGNYAYVSDQNSGLHIIDIENPNSPSIQSTVLAGQYVWGVELTENYLVAGCRGNGIKVYDVSVPSAPVEITLMSGGDAYRIDISGRYVYVANGGYGIRIIDLLPAEL
jgi:hypothetical protein